jgi:hypothetical protein
MPDTAVTGAPFMLDHPVIKIGATGTSVDIACPATNLTVEPDQDENSVDTFCASYTSYKQPKWTITASIAQSYGTSGTWNLLQPLMGTMQPFVIKPDDAAASATNPAMSGTAYVKWVSFIDGGPGEASEVDVELAVQGAPVFGIVEPTMATLEAPAETPAA